ncbi:hypothetical protein, partial [Aeromonas veronii]|uniref:hypothetical protein n=1 Tax=Aeromonas veronii TaxID=654 RepID=UPI001C4C6F7B
MQRGRARREADNTIGRDADPVGAIKVFQRTDVTGFGIPGIEGQFDRGGCVGRRRQVHGEQ